VAVNMYLLQIHIKSAVVILVLSQGLILFLI